MKTSAWFLAAALLFAGLAAGCNSAPSPSAPAAPSGPPKSAEKPSATKGGIQNPPPP